MRQALTKFLLVIALIILLPFLIIFVIIYTPIELWRDKREKERLVSRFREKYVSDGKFVLFAYSNNQYWSPYVENRILPRIAPYTVVVNWPKRKKRRPWDRWEYRLLRRFTGYPSGGVALLIPPSGKVNWIGFTHAFETLKQGDRSELSLVETELFEQADRYAQQVPAQDRPNPPTPHT